LTREIIPRVPWWESRFGEDYLDLYLDRALVRKPGHDGIAGRMP
jgi:hypothetical protein